MLGVIEARGPRKTDRPFLRELTTHYRATTGDLAFAQTHYRGTTLLLFLHQLVARAHNQIYRPHRLSGRETSRFFLNEIPQAVRSHLQAVVWSAIIFMLGIALGLSAVQFDERAASIILPNNISSIRSIRDRCGREASSASCPRRSPRHCFSPVIFRWHCWPLPGDFRLALSRPGFFFRTDSCWVFASSCVPTTACWGLFSRSLRVMASWKSARSFSRGGGGYVVANALLNPGSYSRGDALAQQGRSAVRMALACVPALVTAGCIEAFVSPSNFPIWFKIVLGVALGVSFWLYLLFTGKGKDGNPVPSE